MSYEAIKNPNKNPIDVLNDDMIMIAAKQTLLASLADSFATITTPLDSKLNPLVADERQNYGELCVTKLHRQHHSFPFENKLTLACLPLIIF